MQRREFVRDLTLASSALFLKPDLFNDRVIQLAVIGCGDRGTGIAEVLKEFPSLFRITNVCDVLDFRLKQASNVSTMSSAKQFKDYRKMLEQKDIDAVIVAVPLNMHYQVAKDVIDSNRHLYLEKTMTYNISEAISLASMARKHPSLVMQVGHQYRSSPLYYRVKDIIQKGYIGKVSHVDCRWDRNGSWRRTPPDASLERQVNWRMYKEYSGGLVAELLSHQMDFINWAFDTHPDEFAASGGIDIYKDGRETYDNVQVTLRYNKAGFTGSFGATCGNARDGYLFKIKGTKGTISLLVDQGMYYAEKDVIKQKGTVDGVTGATKIIWDKPEGTPILAEPTKDGTWYALKDFYDKLINGGLPDSNVFTGAKTAICVSLSNEALYNEKITKWKTEYDLN